MLKAIEMVEPVLNLGMLELCMAIIVVDKVQSATSQSLLGAPTLPSTVCRAS